jgi:hypothetical protein
MISPAPLSRKYKLKLEGTRYDDEIQRHRSKRWISVYKLFFCDAQHRMHGILKGQCPLSRVSKGTASLWCVPQSLFTLSSNASAHRRPSTAAESMPPA